MVKRKRSASMYPSPPRTPRRPRLSSPTAARLPRSAGAAAARRMSALRTGRSAIGGLARGAVKAVPYVDAAMMAYQGGKYLYNRYLKKTPRRVGSAANSKSKGFFAPAKKHTSMADKYIENGIVIKQEIGTVYTSQRNVAVVAHSTMPAIQVGITLCAALIKKLFTLAGHKIKNDQELLLDGAYYDGIVRIEFKAKDGAAIQTFDFTVTAATTSLQTLRTAMQAWFTTLFVSGNTFQMLKLRLYMQYGTLANALDLKSEIDLTTATVDLYGKSALKLQNRTVNTTANDQDSDVDNVPIFGKYFEFKSNGTIYRDYNKPVAADNPMVTTHTQFGLLYANNASETDTNMYKELPERTQFVGCSKSASSHLDPGEIKTSVIQSQKIYPFSKLFQLVYGQTANNTGGSNQFWFGYTRLFAWEKMIQAVASTAENQFNLAIENQGEVGAMIYIKRSLQTAPIIQQQIVS